MHAYASGITERAGRIQPHHRRNRIQPHHRGSATQAESPSRLGYTSRITAALPLRPRQRSLTPAHLVPSCAARVNSGMAHASLLWSAQHRDAARPRGPLRTTWSAQDRCTAPPARVPRSTARAKGLARHRTVTLRGRAPLRPSPRGPRLARVDAGPCRRGPGSMRARVDEGPGRCGPVSMMRARVDGGIILYSQECKTPRLARVPCVRAGGPGSLV